MTLKEKELQAIDRLKTFEPTDEPYHLCYSGGKDSDVIRILAKLAGVKHEIHHNLTTVDAPETIAYIKSIPNIIIDKAKYKDGSVKTMWNLIPQKTLPPTRLMRYCCEELKEVGGEGRLKITGVRWAESKNRAENQGGISIIGKPRTTEKYLEQENIEYKKNKKGGIVLNLDNAESRRAVEFCYRTTATLVNPIIDWTDQDVWEFLKHYGCKSNPLYECGHGRIGCIGCPLGGYASMKKEFRIYPKYMQIYIHTFDKMIKVRLEQGKKTEWKSGEEVFYWWLNLDGSQMLFDGFEVLDI